MINWYLLSFNATQFGQCYFVCVCKHDNVFIHLVYCSLCNCIIKSLQKIKLAKRSLCMLFTCTYKNIAMTVSAFLDPNLFLRRIKSMDFWIKSEFRIKSGVKSGFINEPSDLCNFGAKICCKRS